MLKTKRDKVYLAFIALFVIAIVTVVIIALCTRDAKEELPVVTPRPTAEVRIREIERLVEVEKEITSDVLQDGLNDMGIMVTQQYYFTEVVSFSSVKKLLKTDIELKFTESGYLASYDGVVTAGIDFADISVEKSGDKPVITIHIPASEIQNVDVDPNSFRLFSEKNGLGNPLSVEDFNSSLVELENTAVEKAIDRGVLTRADENARQLITNFVSSLADTSKYTLKFITD